MDHGTKKTVKNWVQVHPCNQGAQPGYEARVQATCFSTPQHKGKNVIARCGEGLGIRVHGNY